MERFALLSSLVRVTSALALGACLVAWALPAQAQLAGTRNVPGDYATLEAALTDLNTVGVGAGGVTINLVAANPQTAPAGGYTINLAASNATAANPITLQGNGNIITAFTPQASSLLNDALIRIVGEDFVTIEGFDLRENAANTTIDAGTNNMTEWGIALLYRTVADGAQNISLRGNTITLNRTYQNTFGIYANATHTLAAPTTSVTATAPAGGNSGLVVRGNTISNVNIGVVVVGPTAAANHNAVVTIGGDLVADGNTITNYGTTGTFSSYANVSGTVNGILLRNTQAFSIRNNTLTSSDGGTTAGTLRGIFVVAGSTAPTGTHQQSIRNNSISVRSGVATGALAGIIVESSASTPTSTVTINDNTLRNSGYTLASGTSSGAVTGISLAGSATLGPLATAINGNRLENLTLNTSGNVTLISSSFTRPANGTITANDNAIVTGLSKTLAGGTVRCYDNFGSSPATVSETNTGNNFSNITLGGAGATTLDCWRSADGSATAGSRKTVTNNTFDNIENQTTGGNTILSVTFSDLNFAGNIVSGNTVSNIRSTSATSTATIVGITSSSQNQLFSGNTVRGLRAAGSNVVNGMSITGGSTQVLSGNRIFDLEHSNAAGSVNGILVSAGTTANLQNNLIGDLRAPAANAANPVVGINIAGGTTVNADYNSVNLNATSAGALFGSSALSASTTPTVTLRNNNLVNTSTANGAGVSVAHRRSTATLTTYQAASNANNFFAPSLFNDGTNNDTTLAAYKLRMAPRDILSVSENPPWQSTVGANPNFLNINTSVATQLESGGVPVAGITTDVAGNTRNAAFPDIGAWEFNGTLLDLNPPSIAFAALGTTASTANRTLAATINDPSGVAGGANAPRVYFRKNAGSYFSSACTGAAPSFVCTIDNALMGGVTGGDTINYFVIAQDTVGNVGANPGAGLVATDVNTVTTPPTTPASYNVVSAFPAAVNVGTGEAFTSLTNTGGLFAALNAGVLTGNVAVVITTDLTGETGTVALNQLVEEGAGNYTLTIRPSGARTVSGAPTARLIDFNGADRVTLDGLNASGNSLLIRNEGIGEIVRFINDASSNTLTNLVLEGGAGVTAVAVTSGLVTGNDGIVITRNTVRDRTTPTAGLPFNSIGSTATSLTVQNSNLRIEDNTLINFGQAGVFIGVGSENVRVAGNQISQTAPRTTALLGIAINGMNGNNEVVGNTIRDLETNTTTGQLTGISLGALVGTNLVSGNVIRDLRYTATVSPFITTRGMIIGDVRTATITRNRIFGLQTTTASTGAVIGVQFAGSSANPSNATFVNNYISIAPSAVGAFQVMGIFDFAFANNTFRADYNSVYVGGTASGATASWAYRRGDLTPTLSTVRNNIFYNARTGGTGNHYAIGDQSLNTGTWSSNRNLFVGTGTTAGNHFDLGAASAGTPVSFTTWQAGLPTRDANSTSFQSGALTLSNYFVDAPAGNLDLLATAVGAVNAGAPIAGITTDINGTTRLDPPEIGAFELVEATLSISPPSINFGDVGVGATSAAQTVTLSNTGNAPLTVDPLSAAAVPFARLGGTCSAAPIALAAGASCTLTYTFAPTVIGPAAQTLTVTSSGSGSGTIALSGNGVQGNLTITPTGVNFGSVNVGTPSAEETVTLANTGNISLDVTALTAAAAPFTRTGSGNCSASLPITIAAGGSCTLTYTFTPASVGPASQNLTVTANAPGSGTIALSGTGVAAEFSVTPNPVAFGNQLVGTTSATLTATLANTGTGALTVSALPDPTAPFARSGGTCAAAPFVLGAGSSCTVAYTFAPTAAGPASGSVAIGSSVGPVSLALTGTGTQGSLSIAPTSVPFGNTPIGSSSAPQNVTLSNVGTAALDVTALTTAAAPFAATGGTCGAALPITIAAGGSCTLTYTFSPTATGASNQVLTVTANAPGSGTITLTGTGTPAANLSIVKSSAVNLIGLGLIQYNLVVANAGPSAVTGAVVADTFPVGLTNVLWSCVGIGGGSCVANGTGNINQLVDLPNGATVVFSITANVPLPLPNAIVNTATVTAPSGTTDPVLTNNTSTVNDVILIFADGFEAAPVVLVLPETASGEARATTLSGSAIAAAAVGPVATDALRYQVAGSSAVVQARRIGNSVEVRVLSVDAAGEWTIGSWLPTGGSSVQLEWSTGAAVGGRVPVSLRLRVGN